MKDEIKELKEEVEELKEKCRLNWLRFRFWNTRLERLTERVTKLEEKLESIDTKTNKKIKETVKKTFDLINLGYDISEDSNKVMLKERVEQLLKEIEKKEKTMKQVLIEFLKVGAPEGRIRETEGILTGIGTTKELVKEAFKEVLEDEKE